MYLNFFVVNPVFTYDLQLEIENRDGIDYAKIKSSTISHTLKEVRYKFENLFNGDERLGEFFYILFLVGLLLSIIVELLNVRCRYLLHSVYNFGIVQMQRSFLF